MLPLAFLTRWLDRRIDAPAVAPVVLKKAKAFSLAGSAVAVRIMADADDSVSSGCLYLTHDQARVLREDLDRVVPAMGA